MPRFDPEDVAAQAVSQLDTNGDGSLTEEELRASPGLLASLSDFDQNGNRQLTAAEIAGRLNEWRRDKSALLPLRCQVTLKGKPLSDATVTLVPEPFFGDSIPPASGVTDFTGSAELSCDKEHLPSQLKNIRAVKPGIYRVLVTHPRVDLPAVYNTDTTLGRSVSLRNCNTLHLQL